MNKKGLGKGLRALITTYSTEDGDRHMEGAVPTDSIVSNRNQPRQHFNQEGMHDLIESIRENGILQPLTVHDVGDGQYELIAGERRLRAALELGLPTVPVYVISVETDVEMLELALVENIQRENLDPIEEAEGYAILAGKHNLTQENIAKRVSKSRAAIANSLRLLKLPTKVKDSLRAGKISSGHAKALLGLANGSAIENLYERIVRDRLSVRQTEELVRNLTGNRPSKAGASRKPAVKPQIIIDVENRIRSVLGTKVLINRKRTGKGKIVLEFYSDEDLNRLLELITRIEN